jgi:flagellar basal-body rod protein FlgC
MITPLDISTSALVAQRTRLNAIANNIANLSTTRDETGAARPYQPRYVVFQTEEQAGDALGAAGVRVDEVRISDAEPRLKYEPHHPDANAEGFVAYPNIDMTTEFVDALEAARAYEANLGVIEVSKDLNNQTLKILA